MKDHVWAILGAIPGSGQVIVLGFIDGSIPVAEKYRDGRVAEHFKEDADKAVCVMFDLLGRRPKQTRLELKAYLRSVRVPEHELNRVVKLFANKLLNRIKQKN